MSIQSGTVNAIGNVSTEIGGGKVVWAEVRRTIQFGRKIDVSKYSAGDVIPAGSMVKYDNASDECNIITADEITAGTYAAADVNGLTFEDVCIPTGCVFASVAIVTSGKIWADFTDIPAEVEKNLPMIEFIRMRH